MAKEPDRFACPTCGFSSTVAQLKQGFEWEADEKSFSFYCPHCESWFTFPGSAQDWRHVKKGQPWPNGEVWDSEEVKSD